MFTLSGALGGDAASLTSATGGAPSGALSPAPASAAPSQKTISPNASVTMRIQFHFIPSSSFTKPDVTRSPRQKNVKPPGLKPKLANSPPRRHRNDGSPSFLDARLSPMPDDCP